MYVKATAFMLPCCKLDDPIRLRFVLLLLQM